MQAGRINKRLLAVGSKGALDTFGAEEEIGEMVGGAVGAISAIDRLDHLADLEGRVVRGASGNQLCPHRAQHAPDKKSTRVRTQATSRQNSVERPGRRVCREW